MTKQELEKAIENGESVWCAYENRMVLEIGKSKVLKITDDQIKYFNDYYKCEAYGFMNDFFVTKAEAEHYLHHANITRTETLPFLTWEEFKEIGQISFIGKDKEEYILKRDIIWSNNKYTLVDCLKNVNETDFTFLKYFDYTEENFYKAYDECVRLFKGEE